MVPYSGVNTVPKNSGPGEQSRCYCFTTFPILCGMCRFRIFGSITVVVSDPAVVGILLGSTRGVKELPKSARIYQTLDKVDQRIKQLQMTYMSAKYPFKLIAAVSLDWGIKAIPSPHPYTLRGSLPDRHLWTPTNIQLRAKIFDGVKNDFSWNAALSIFKFHIHFHPKISDVAFQSWVGFGYFGELRQC